MAPTLFTVTFLSLALTSLAEAYNVLHTVENATGTFYYDYGYESTWDRCAGRGSGAGMLSSVPHCENNGPSYSDLGTNRIVAMNRSMVNGDLSAWCGKEVKVFLGDGTEVEYDEPLVLWDVCEAAETAPIIDFSVDFYLNLMENGDCMSNNGNNPAGLKIQIVDNQIWAPAPGSDSYSPCHTGP